MVKNVHLAPGKIRFNRLQWSVNSLGSVISFCITSLVSKLITTNCLYSLYNVCGTMMTIKGSL